MSESCILACDIGTSSVKTAIFQADGSLVASAVHPHATTYQQPGWAGQNPQDWWQGFQRNMQDLLEQVPDIRSRIAVIGVSGHMLGCLPVDCSGQPLYQALIHADNRAAAQNLQICASIGAEPLYALTGNILEPRSSLCKMLWFKQQEPAIYKRTARFLQSKDYLVARMTGNIDTTDLSDASHAQWIDIDKRTYLTGVFQELALDPTKLPSLHRGTDIVGSLTRQAAAELGLPDGIPVIAGAGDGACASVGAGSALSGNLYCCLGTTAWIAYASDQPIFDRRQRLFNLLSTDGLTCGVFGTTQSAGQAVLWAMDLFQDADARAFDKLAVEVPPGSGSLIFLPYLDGERSPIFDANARGVFFGLSSMHRPEHFRRAVLEGVAMALRSIIGIYRENTDLQVMRLIGGGAKSALWRTIIADACGLTLERLTTPAGDETALGIALTAAVGVGLFPDLRTALQTIGIRDRQQPDGERRLVYDRMFPIFEQLYQANKPIFCQLAEDRL